MGRVSRGSTGPVGRAVIADTADEAIDAAAVEFNTDIKKLIAVRRYEIA